MGWGMCGGYGYSAPATFSGYGDNFALIIVVLFILLIIVGAIIG